MEVYVQCEPYVDKDQILIQWLSLRKDLMSSVVDCKIEVLVT